MKVGCLGLRCLDVLKNKDKKYDPKSESFRSDLVLRVLEEKASEPKEAMLQFREWLISYSKGNTPILASDCDAFDGMWIHSYFDKFKIDNPFIYGGLNIESLYQGFMRDPVAQVSDSKFWKKNLTHNAVEDAIIQAKALEGIIRAMKKMQQFIL